jgi:diamine N-acetyltransferase
MQAELKPIDQHNFAMCVGLNVAPDQVDFVASNLHSLAEAYAFPAFEPRAVYVDGTMVGFLMYGFGDQSHKWWIIRLMIDHAHQGKGYGRAAMHAAIDLLRQQPDCHEIMISYAPNNEVARRLYASVGFQETGEVIEGETVARLPIDKTPEQIAH